MRERFALPAVDSICAAFSPTSGPAWAIMLMTDGFTPCFVSLPSAAANATALCAIDVSPRNGLPSDWRLKNPITDDLTESRSDSAACLISSNFFSAADLTLSPAVDTVGAALARPSANDEVIVVALGLDLVGRATGRGTGGLGDALPVLTGGLLRGEHLPVDAASDVRGGGADVHVDGDVEVGADRVQRRVDARRELVEAAVGGLDLAADLRQPPERLGLRGDDDVRRLEERQSRRRRTPG